MALYFHFRVQLLEVDPPIWREFLLKKAATFANLHQALQDACGWQDCHLFAFRKTQRGPAIAGIPDDFYGHPDPDARQVKVASHFKIVKQKCLYQYDFGDDWWHEVRLLGIVSQEERFVRKLLAGERAFPPEDCGGICGYEESVAIRTGMAIPLDEEELAERKLWLGDWQPERFDLASTARQFNL